MSFYNHRFRFTIAGAFCLSLCGATTIASANTIHVPDDFPTIQEGIDAAVDGDEVVVADGVYTGDGNRNIDYLGKSIIVRSENGPDNCIVDLQETGNRGFLFVNGESEAAVLDGFTIRNAWFEAEDVDLRGGAILIEDASPAISNCIFLTNVLISEELSSYGGAVFSRGSPTLTQCTFQINVAFSGLRAEGGAFYNDGGVPTFVDCYFDDNLSLSQLASGGAIGGSGSIALLQCTFIDNHVGTTTPGSGGAVKMDSAKMINCHFEANGVSMVDSTAGGAVAIDSGLLFNCVFAANVADNGGGFSGSAEIHNCTFTQNEANLGAAIDGDAVVSNTVAWNNTGDSINGAVVTYSDIQGGWAGEGNIDADPLFVDPDNGDYRLSPGSPCIDAGDNTTVVCALFDLDGNERFADDPRTRDTGFGRPPITDMGAYEFGSPSAGRGDDCNLNGLDDECELAGGITLDCNRNGIPDDCDIVDGFSLDCDGNGVPDECEAFGDCNGNGVPDVCDIADGTSIDCNDNGIPDECDIADGLSEDCNDNGVPDECDLVFVVASEILGPVQGGISLSFFFEKPPTAIGDVSVVFIVSADLDDVSEQIDVEFNGVAIGSVFAEEAHDCPNEADEDELVIDSRTYNELVEQFGFALIRMIATAEVGACDGSFIQGIVSYDTDANDGNGNGIPDECEKADCTWDLDGDDSVGTGDLILLLGSWGDPYNTQDLIELLGNWGPCPK